MIEGNASMLDIFDMHCHLGFSPAPHLDADALSACGVGALCATVTPAEYESAASELSLARNVRVGVGLHPWWVADGACGPDAFDALERAVADTPFLAEVGLDFAPRRAGTEAVQAKAFERVARLAAACEGAVLSVHAVRAAGAALDALEGAGVFPSRGARRSVADSSRPPDSAPIAIFHWFSGTSDELNRAIALGCFFSINPRMLETKRGRAYAKAIPEQRLLLETDLPAHEGERLDAHAVRSALDGMLDALAGIRRIDRDALAARVVATSTAILSREGGKR